MARNLKLLQMRGEWHKFFQQHILAFEKFLSESPTKLTLPGEQSVYLSGMLARQYDSNYRRQIRHYLFRKPDDLEMLIRRHYQCIGQNAPVCFLSRINAEFLTIRLVSRRSRQATWQKLEQTLPAHYFEVASIYAYQANKRTWGSIFAYIYKNYTQILSLLSAYLDFLQNLQDNNAWDPNTSALGRMLWQRFARVNNERNAQKEHWEANRISPQHKTHIHRHEFNQMINFSSIN